MSHHAPIDHDRIDEEEVVDAMRATRVVAWVVLACLVAVAVVVFT